MLRSPMLRHWSHLREGDDVIESFATKTVRIRSWTLGRRTRALWQKYGADADAVIYVVDTSETVHVRE